jgi:hypothetical protein
VDIDLEFKAAVEVKPASAHACSRCGAIPTLVKTLLDSRKGKSILIMKCSCGNETWQEAT